MHDRTWLSVALLGFLSSVAFSQLNITDDFVSNFTSPTAGNSSSLGAGNRDIPLPSVTWQDYTFEGALSDVQPHNPHSATADTIVHHFSDWIGGYKGNFPDGAIVDYHDGFGPATLITIKTPVGAEPKSWSTIGSMLDMLRRKAISNTWEGIGSLPFKATVLRQGQLIMKLETKANANGQRFDVRGEKWGDPGSMAAGMVSYPDNAMTTSVVVQTLKAEIDKIIGHFMTERSPRKIDSMWKIDASVRGALFRMVLFRQDQGPWPQDITERNVLTFLMDLKAYLSPLPRVQGFEGQILSTLRPGNVIEIGRIQFYQHLYIPTRLGAMSCSLLAGNSTSLAQDGCSGLSREGERNDEAVSGMNGTLSLVGATHGTDSIVEA